MSSIKTTQIDGDIAVGRNIAMGGDAHVAGNTTVEHNLTVKGWLEAPNIKDVNKGIWATLLALQTAYPDPHDGWFAGVGDSTPFAAYIGQDGEWVATGGTINVDVDITRYEENIEQLCENLTDMVSTTPINSNDDLDLGDENGNVILELSGGHIRTKNFDSRNIGGQTYEFDDSESDLDLGDENGNVILELSGGHIRTKNFDSRNIECTNISIRKAVFMGDSITHGVYSYFDDNIHDDNHRYNGFDISNLSSVAEATAYHGIPYYFGLIANCEVVNLAKRGSGYVIDGRHIGNAVEVANAYDFSNTDFVALCFGVNDYIQGATIGDLTNKASGTVIGNMCTVLQKISTDNPLCKIVVYSPYNTFGQVSKGGDYASNSIYGDESTDYALGAAPTGKTHTLQEYIDAIDSVCSYYGIQHVLLSKSNVCNRLTLKNIMVDGLHPTKESYLQLASEIYGKGNFGA